MNDPDFIQDPSLLRALVFEHLDSARDNGYDKLLESDPFEIAQDMIMYSVECEDLTEDQIIPHIRDWMIIQQKS